MVDKPSSVVYSYAQQPAQHQGAASPAPAAGHVSYPMGSGGVPQQQQQQGAPFYPSQPGPPPPPNNAFAVGTPAYYVHPYHQQQSHLDSCVGPQLWLFVLGWLLAPFFFVGALLPACVPLRPAERGLWIANIVMSMVSFTLAIIIATSMPIVKYGMHGDGVT